VDAFEDFPTEAEALAFHDRLISVYPHLADAAREIATLNDLCRRAMGVAGRVVQTQGIASLPTPDNDPHGERDFGAYEHNGQRIFWKIDYYDTTLTKGSEDPGDPDKTVRVLTIMLASEY
jgi:hypothetical protein